MPWWMMEFLRVLQMSRSVHCTITMDIKNAVWHVNSSTLRWAYVYTDTQTHRRTDRQTYRRTATCFAIQTSLTFNNSTAWKYFDGLNWDKCQTLQLLIDWLSCGFTSHSTQNRWFRRRSPKPISWLGMEKLNLTQQKHTFANQNKCTAIQNKHKLMPGLVLRVARWCNG